MKINYITSNAKKFEEAQHVLSDDELERIDIDLTEIQGDRISIARAKAKEALKRLNKPLIVEDISLECRALNSLPGPYVKDFLKLLGEDGLAELVHKYADHHVEAVCVAAYIEPGHEPQIFEGRIEGTIVRPRGTHRHGARSWNTIFLPKGSEKTFGEMTMKEHSKCSMRAIALKKLKKYLLEKEADHVI